ncbi:MAG: hypothetical protein QNL14_14470 [Deltaproteobacteria bacterium]|nr:hypothetical protein [Deltaproteobacteria bacterium]
MDNWIPLGEGEYLVEQALLVTEDDKAVAVDDVIVEIYADKRGQRHMKGRGRVRNILVVELLEDSDDLDLFLDFGDEFKFLLKEPNLQAGKVFAPDARSVLQFIPQSPWQEVAPEAYADLMARLRILTDSDIS